MIIKKASVRMSDYSGRPTFSDLVGPVRLYRQDRFTSKIVYYYYSGITWVCQVQFHEKSVSEDSTMGLLNACIFIEAAGLCSRKKSRI